MKYIITLLKIAMVVFFVVATGDKNREFYEILRWSVLGAFAYFSWFSYKTKNASFAIFFAFGVVLFNPFMVPHFSEATWRSIDWLFACLLSVSIFADWFKSVPFNMPAISITRKMVIREVVLLLCVVGLYFVCVGFVGLKNDHYSKQIEVIQKRIDSANSELRNQPTSFVWHLYQEMYPLFSERYVYGVDTFIVSNSLLDKFRYNYPNAVRIASPSASLAVYYKDSRVVKFTDQVPESPESLSEAEYDAILKEYDNKVDYIRDLPIVEEVSAKRVVDFYYTPISYDEFRRKIVLGEYSFFIESLLGRKIYSYDIANGVGYTNEVWQRKNELRERIKASNDRISEISEHIVPSWRMHDTALFWSGVLAFIVYLIRPAIGLISHVVKSMKNRAQSENMPTINS